MTFLNTDPIVFEWLVVMGVAIYWNKNVINGDI